MCTMIARCQNEYNFFVTCSIYPMPHHDIRIDRIIAGITKLNRYLYFLSAILDFDMSKLYANWFQLAT